VQGRSLPRQPTGLYLWFRVGISTVLEIIGHFLFKEWCPWDPRVLWSWLNTITYSLTLGIRIYGLWVGILKVFKILEHLWFKGDVTIPFGHDQHTIKCSFRQGTRIYMVYGWGSQRFSIYLSISGFKGTGPLRMAMIYIPSDATWHTKQEYIYIYI
jgi:hypothetical protein